MTNNERTLEQLHSFFKAHGYIVMMEPIEGEEDQFIATLKVARDKIDDTMKFGARRHGFRGLSRPALGWLHSVLPEPTWGVELIDCGQ